MEKKVKKAVIDKCKDFGLSAKAIEDLVTLTLNGLDTDASDEDIEEKVDSVVPFAKLMQAEVTRKTQKKSTKKVDDDDDDDKDPNEARFTALEAKIAELVQKNADLEAEKARGERASLIKSKAKSLGIPEYLIQRFNIGDDEDYEKVLTDYKQDLITNNLLPKGSASEKSTSEEQMKADAKAYAESLPNN